jgi:hypothetical protein
MLNQSAGDAAEPNGAVSLAEAINKQLGLRLERRKRRPGLESGDFGLTLLLYLPFK